MLLCGTEGAAMGFNHKRKRVKIVLEKQKKRNRFITLAVCLMMLVTLVAPVDTAIIHAAVPELQNPRTGADGNVTWPSSWQTKILMAGFHIMKPTAM